MSQSEAETSPRTHLSEVTDARFGLQQSPESSFTAGGEEELQELKNKLSEEEVNNRELQERLRHTQQLLEEKEVAHAEQVTWKFVQFSDYIYLGENLWWIFWCLCSPAAEASGCGLREGRAFPRAGPEARRRAAERHGSVSG